MYDKLLRGCLLGLLLALLTLCAAGMAEETAEITDAGGQWRYVLAGEEAVLTGWAGEAYDAVLALPEALDGHPVTAIGEGAFSYCPGVERIRIPASVERMAGNPFASYSGGLLAIEVETGNPRYESVDGVLMDRLEQTLVACPRGKEGAYTVPEGVTHIGERAFYGCYLLTSMVLLEGVETIGKEAFAICSRLEHVALPEEMDSIGEAAFAHCLSLEALRIPGGVTRIGGGTFYECANLAWVGIPASVRHIEGNPFTVHQESSLVWIAVSPENPWYASVDGVLYDAEGKTLRVYPAGREGGYVVPEGVERIGMSAFGSCWGLDSLTLPESLRSIGAWALAETGVTRLRIPAGVTAIGEDAFPGMWEDALFPGALRLVLEATAGSAAQQYAWTHSIPCVVSPGPTEEELAAIIEDLRRYGAEEEMDGWGYHNIHGFTEVPLDPDAFLRDAQAALGIEDGEARTAALQGLTQGLGFTETEWPEDRLADMYSAERIDYGRVSGPEGEVTLSMVQLYGSRFFFSYVFLEKEGAWFLTDRLARSDWSGYPDITVMPLMLLREGKPGAWLEEKFEQHGTGIYIDYRKWYNVFTRRYDICYVLRGHDLNGSDDFGMRYYAGWVSDLGSASGLDGGKAWETIRYITYDAITKVPIFGEDAEFVEEVESWMTLYEYQYDQETVSFVRTRAERMPLRNPANVEEWGLGFSEPWYEDDEP